ncbi:MAG: hypothetical protein OHK0028_23660 [Deltaproteobacteria bacterium]
MKTVVITYKGIVIRDPNRSFGKRAVAGDVVTVGDDDASLLIGMGRAKLYEPPKEPPKGEPEKDTAEREPAREPKKEAHGAPPRSERKKE